MLHEDGKKMHVNVTYRDQSVYICVCVKQK